MALVKAWLASSAAFAVAFAVWSVLRHWSFTERLLPYPAQSLRQLAMAFGAGLIVQLVYGGLTYVLLTRTGVWRFWTVALFYLASALVIGFFLSDTPQDLVGIIPWLVLALIVAVVSWYFASPQDK
jgi:hypothetical protein